LQYGAIVRDRHFPTTKTERQSAVWVLRRLGCT